MRRAGWRFWTEADPMLGDLTPGDRLELVRFRYYLRIAGEALRTYEDQSVAIVGPETDSQSNSLDGAV